MTSKFTDILAYSVVVFVFGSGAVLSVIMNDWFGVTLLGVASCWWAVLLYDRAARRSE